MGKFVELRGFLKNLLASQRFAVLATQLDGQPYCNLVAFAETDDLKSLLFVTSRNTKKYRNIITDEKVAVLVDNRINQVSDLNTAVAVTALGTVEEVPTTRRSYLAEIYVSKHPDLAEFIGKQANALMQITVEDYVVASFGEVKVLHFGSQNQGS